MRCSSVVAALAAFAPLAVTALDAEPDHFTLEQVEGGLVRRSLIHEIRDVHYKYNGSAPQWLEDAVARKDAAIAAGKASGTVKATPEKYDREYLIPVKLGTPAQLVKLTWDTGSSDLWSFSSLQPKGQRAGHEIYTPSKSKSSKKIPDTWKIKYGDGSSSSGSVYKDKVEVGGLTVGSQAVEAAKTVSKEFLQLKTMDGIIGAGFSSINQVRPTKQKTFIANLLPRLKSPIVGAALNHHAPGHYDIGHLDKSKYKGPIHYTAVSKSAGVFLFEVGGFHTGKKSGGGFRAIADTGTSVILVPKKIIVAYYSQIKGAALDETTGQYVFPCKEKPPPISFTIGGSKRTVPSSYLNYAPDTVHKGVKYCAGGLQANTGLGDVAIMGALFLKSQYVVFNYATPKLGFADKK